VHPHLHIVFPESLTTRRIERERVGGRAGETAVADLVQDQDLFEDEYREYIVGYICKIIDR
jgi:hypothetical protein